MTQRSEKKLFAICIFIVTNQNKTKKRIFLFHRQITVYWQNQNIDFNSVWSKKDKNKNLKIVILFCRKTLIYWAPC